MEEQIKNSILASVTKMITGTEGDDYFNLELVIHINTVFSILHNLGVGPKIPFKIEDESATWSEFLEDKDTLEMVKTYMYYKVKLTFDPPTNSFLVDAYTNQAKELEWRMKEICENYLEEGDSDE